MPNKAIPAAAEGVPSLIDVIDQMSHTKGMLNLISYALDGMADGDPEINALQHGVSEATERLASAYRMLEAHREANR